MTHHFFHDPADGNILNLRIGHPFAIPQDGYIIADADDFLQAMGNIDDGDAALFQILDQFKQHLDLRIGKRGCGFIHD